MMEACHPTVAVLYIRSIVYQFDDRLPKTRESGWETYNFHVLWHFGILLLINTLATSAQGKTPARAFAGKSGSFIAGQRVHVFC